MRSGSTSELLRELFLALDWVDVLAHVFSAQQDNLYPVLGGTTSLLCPLVYLSTGDRSSAITRYREHAIPPNLATWPVINMSIGVVGRLLRFVHEYVKPFFFEN